MSRPRPVIPGATVFVTRRCLERRFFLRPDTGVTELVSYLFAVACEQYGVEPIAVCAMSNHYHAILHDRYGRLPEFLRWFHAMVAKAVNARRGRWDRFWDGRQTHVCLFGEPADVVAKAAYVLANPTAAGLVREGKQWPGLRSAPGACAASKPRVVRRPDLFFVPGHSLPDEVELRYFVPPTHDHLTTQAFARLLSKEVSDLEARLRAEAKADGRGFLGPRRVKGQWWDAGPSEPERRRSLAPRVAARSEPRRRALLDMLETFAKEHADALRVFRSGWRDVRFPGGTWLLPVVYGVRVHPPPAA